MHASERIALNFHTNKCNLLESEKRELAALIRAEYAPLEEAVRANLKRYPNLANDVGSTEWKMRIELDAVQSSEPPPPAELAALKAETAAARAECDKQQARMLQAAENCTAAINELVETMKDKASIPGVGFYAEASASLR